MDLAGERSDKEIATAHALAAVEAALSQLAANIMRVAAGGGRAHQLVSEASEFVEAYAAFREAAEVYPSSFQLEDMLKPKPDAMEERLSDESLRQARAVEMIETGVLRAVAARLVGPRVQEVRALHLMYDGIDTILGLRREREEKRVAAALTVQTIKRATQKRSK